MERATRSLLHQLTGHGLARFVLGDGLGQVRGVGRGGEQVHGFHDALVLANGVFAVSQSTPRFMQPN